MMKSGYIKPFMHYKTNSKEYHVEFNTDKIENSINQGMYQPTTINKFIVK